MRSAVRLVPLVTLVAGCGFAQKPYADDPLLRGGRAVWSVHDAPPPAPPAPAGPAVIEPPPPPAVPTSPQPE
jgi:hypothetical protein